MEKANNSNPNSNAQIYHPPPPYFDFDETFNHAPFTPADYNTHHNQLIPLPLPTTNSNINTSNKRKHEQLTNHHPSAKSYRKAPQAPKHFKSPYVCFATAHQAQVKSEMGSNAKVSQVSAKLGDMWRTLTPQERTVWDEAAERDKARYLTEKAAYTGPWKVPSKKKKKHPDAPKRPMSAFLFYSQKLRGELKVKHPNKRNTEISRMLGELWRNAPSDVRAKHVQREADERAKYKVALAEFNETLKVQEDCNQEDDCTVEDEDCTVDDDDTNPGMSSFGGRPHYNHPPPYHHHHLHSYHGPPRHHHPHGPHYEPITPAPFPYYPPPGYAAHGHAGHGGSSASAKSSMFAQRHYHPSSRWFSPMEEPHTHAHTHHASTGGAGTSPIRPAFTTRTSPIKQGNINIALSTSSNKKSSNIGAAASWEEVTTATEMNTNGTNDDGDEEWVEGSD